MDLPPPAYSLRSGESWFSPGPGVNNTLVACSFLKVAVGIGSWWWSGRCPGSEARRPDIPTSSCSGLPLRGEPSSVFFMVARLRLTARVLCFVLLLPALVLVWMGFRCSWVSVVCFSYGSSVTLRWVLW